MMERWIMHIKRFVHLLTFRHTAYFTIRFFRALFTGVGGNIANRAISLLLRAPEVMTDFFMCITWPAAHLCGVQPAAFLYIAGKDAR